MAEWHNGIQDRATCARGVKKALGVLPQLRENVFGHSCCVNVLPPSDGRVCQRSEKGATVTVHFPKTRSRAPGERKGAVAGHAGMQQPSPPRPKSRRRAATNYVQRRSRVHATNTSGYCADVLSSNAGRRPSRQPSCNQPMSAEPTLARWLANGLALTRPLRACEVGLKQFRGLMKLLGYNTKQ